MAISGDEREVHEHLHKVIIEAFQHPAAARLAPMVQANALIHAAANVIRLAKGDPIAALVSVALAIDSARTVELVHRFTSKTASKDAN